MNYKHDKKTFMMVALIFVSFNMEALSKEKKISEWETILLSRPLCENGDDNKIQSKVIKYDQKILSSEQTFKVIGECNNGSPIEQWVWFYTHSSLAVVGKFLNGRPNGHWIWYYSFPHNQKRREGRLVNGFEDGLWSTFHFNGTLSSQGTYILGKKSNKWTHFYSSGRVLSKENYINNAKNGLLERFFDKDGLLRLRAQYDNGKLYGQYQEWNIKGKLILDCKIKKIKKIKCKIKEISFKESSFLSIYL